MSFEDGAQLPLPRINSRGFGRAFNCSRLFPGRLDSFATHTSGATPPEYLFYRDRSDDGGTKPLWEALRFASFAPHNLPCRERFAERFSEGVLAHATAQDV